MEREGVWYKPFMTDRALERWNRADEHDREADAAAVPWQRDYHENMARVNRDIADTIESLEARWGPIKE